MAGRISSKWTYWTITIWKFVSIKKRYDGERRNPWNEFECGSNYARSMASYALLNAFSGFQFDMTKQSIGFNPVEGRDDFCTFWSLDTGWGEFAVRIANCELHLCYGKLSLKTLHLPFLNGRRVIGVSLSGQPVTFTRDGDAIDLGNGVTIANGKTLQIAF